MARPALKCLNLITLYRSISNSNSKTGRTRFWSHVGLLTVAVLLGARVEIALAQDPAAGILPFSTHVGGQYDSIDLATSNILITIPIRSKAGALPLNFNLTENNRIYKNPGSSDGPTLSQAIIHTGGTEYMSVNMNAVTFAADLDARVVSWRSRGIAGGCGTHKTDFLYDNFVIADASGGQHPFGTSVSVDQFGCNPSPSSGPATDGSGYTLVLTTGWSAVIYDKAGNQMNGQTVTDPDGNHFTITYGISGNTYTETYTDTLGIVALTANINSALTPGASDTYVYTDANGNNQTATVNYGSFTWRTNFNCNDQHMTHGLQLYLVSSVSLPDGTSFALTYEQTPGYPGNGQYGQYTTGVLLR